MAEYQELVRTLTWLLTNRVQQKIQYTHGLLGDGNGRVRVSTAPGNPEVDYVYVRPDRFSNRAFKVFNKRIEGQDGDPIIIGELPWEPDLIQVVDMDWAAYADVGWGDDVTTTNRHGITHQWRDGAPGIDAFNVYRRQFGDLKTYPAISGTLAVGVSPYSLDIYGNQYQWPGTQSFSLSGALPAGTGTARMVLVYWDSSSGTTQGFLGVATGTLGSSADATILNRPVTPEGAIPSAFVRLRGGQNSITEFDIWDAREPFRPGILFSTGSPTGLNAGLIPIADNAGLYTGSTVEAALEQIGYDGARVSKVYESDFGNVVMSIGATGQTIFQPAVDSTTFFQILDADGGTPVVNVDSTNERFGIGTATIPHGGVGAGIVAIEGADSSVASGPTMQFTTSADDYPLIQYLNYSHDNIQWQFDAYFDAGGQKSSDVGSNFRLSKAGDRFQLQYNAGTAQGNVFSWSDGWSLLSTGLMGIGISTGQAGKLHVDQADGSATIPVLYLDQGNASQDMVEFNTTIGVGNAIEAVGAKTLTPTHFIKCTLPGGLTRYWEVGTIA